MKVSVFALTGGADSTKPTKQSVCMQCQCAKRTAVAPPRASPSQENALSGSLHVACVKLRMYSILVGYVCCTGMQLL